jgi:hypothetical protein
MSRGARRRATQHIACAAAAWPTAAWPAAVCALALAGACSDRGRAGRDHAPQTTAPVESRGTVAPLSEESAMIEVKAAEAEAKGLPRIGFRVDPSGTSLSITAFPPQPDKYLVASGPPGGPLLAGVWATDERESDAAAIERAVRKYFSNPWQEPLVIGEASTIALGGKTYPALAYRTGTSLRLTAWCAAIVGNGPSLLVTLGRAPGDAPALSCADVIAEPNLAAFARTFTLVP